MFIFPPPPPRLSATGIYGPGGVLNGQTLPVPETANVLSHPSGPEYSFSVGEGTYILRDDVYLATPPPHPSEPAITNNNPLATTPIPLTTGTKLSLLTTTPSSNKTHAGIGIKSDGTESEASLETEGVDDGSEAGGYTGSGSGTSKNGERQVEVFGSGNAALLASMKDAKKKKQKSNISKSNSSFISRIVTHDSITTRLTKRSPDDLFVFANINRAFHWLDMGNPKKHEPLSKVLFTKSHPLCHDANMVTKSPAHMDVVIGFSSGDIMWFDPMTNKYARINKNGQINRHPVTDIKWLPGSETLFLATHTDGSMIVYDKDKEDGAITLEAESGSSTTTAGKKEAGGFVVKKSVESKNQKTNPVAYWKVSAQPINAFAFSPDSTHLAVVSDDGCLRIIDFLKEKLLDVYNGYYGGMSCVCWSPDGRYILTGGQDDLVSIWSFADRRIVARCEGHHSWVTCVAFDPWRCDERTYRFGSVGEDCRLLLWDFSVGMLHRPKATSPHRGSLSSNHGPNIPTVADRLRADAGLQSDASLAATVQEMSETAHHPVEARARTAVLPPVMSKVVDSEPLTSLVFREDCIITTCLDGHIRTWDRPNFKNPNESKKSTSSQVTL